MRPELPWPVTPIPTLPCVFQALMSLFVLASKDGWVNIMYNGLDAVAVDQQVGVAGARAAGQRGRDRVFLGPSGLKLESPKPTATMSPTVSHSPPLSILS